MTDKTQDPATASEVLFEGRFLRFVKKNDWEYVERPWATGIVAVLAMTDQRELVLIEQFRTPLNARVIEVPAGLAGDVVGEENEALTQAARRELLEETGYEAEQMQYLMEGPPSAGLSTEMITFFRARGLKKVSEGGGDHSENIQVHLVPVADVEAWAESKRKEGCLVDYKIYLALYFCGQISSV